MGYPWAIGGAASGVGGHAVRSGPADTAREMARPIATTAGRSVAASTCSELATTEMAATVLPAGR